MLLFLLQMHFSVQRGVSVDLAHSLHYLGPLSRHEKINFLAWAGFLQKLQNKNAGSLSSTGSSDWPYSLCALGVFCHLLLESYGGSVGKKKVSCTPKCLCIAQRGCWALSAQLCLCTGSVPAPVSAEAALCLHQTDLSLVNSAWTWWSVGYTAGCWMKAQEE